MCYLHTSGITGMYRTWGDGGEGGGGLEVGVIGRGGEGPYSEPFLLHQIYLVLFVNSYGKALFNIHNTMYNILANCTLAYLNTVLHLYPLQLQCSPSCNISQTVLWPIFTTILLSIIVSIKIPYKGYKYRYHNSHLYME